MSLFFSVRLLALVPYFFFVFVPGHVAFVSVTERSSMVQLLERLVSRPIGESVEDIDLSRLDKTLAHLHMEGVLFYNELEDCVQLWSEGSKLGIQRYLATQSQSRTETVRQDPPVRLRTGTRAL